MNNAELIRTLDRDHLLLVVETLSRACVYPDDDFDEMEDMFFLEDEIFEYLKGLTDYQRLKLMQQIINTLTHEAEQSTVRHFQTLLPIKSEEFYRP